MERSNVSRTSLYLGIEKPYTTSGSNVGQERSKRRGDAQTLTTWMENALLSVSSFRSLSRRDLAPAGRDHTKEAIATLLQQYLMDPLPCDGHRARTFVGLMDSKQELRII